MNYYNENDKYKVTWLEELIKAKVISEGIVDSRSIEDVTAQDVKGFKQCHFFAGIGGWSYALRLAEWPDDELVWTASCPCQPFSLAGKRKGNNDKRHLWPILAKLIEEYKPTTAFGEQVASKDGRKWLAGVFADLEGMGYRRAGADLCAAGKNAPHIRQRLYWVADSERDSSERRGRCRNMVGTSSEVEKEAQKRKWRGYAAGNSCTDDNGLANSQEAECEPSGDSRSGRAGFANGGGLGNTSSKGFSFGQGQKNGQGTIRNEGQTVTASDTWNNFELADFIDGKKRRFERGTFPLVNGLLGGMVPGGDPGVPEAQATAEARKMRLSGYGDAIVPQLAAEFIKAYLET